MCLKEKILFYLFLLVDSRHYPSVEDIESYELLKEANKKYINISY